MIFDLVGKYFRALLHSDDVGHELSSSGVTLNKLSIFKVSLGFLNLMLWLTFPVTLIFVFKRKRGFAVFEGAKRIGMYVVSGVVGLAFLDLLLIMITGTFFLPNISRFIVASIELISRPDKSSVASSDGSQGLKPEDFAAAITGVLATFVSLQYAVSMGFVIFSLVAYILASYASISGKKDKPAVFLLNWSLILLTSLYSWHLVAACVVGSMCMPVHNPSIEYALDFKVEGINIFELSVQENLTVIRTCDKVGYLDDALLAAARIKNVPLHFTNLIADPSSNTISTAGLDITKHINKADWDCKEFGNTGVAAINEVCTGLLKTYDTMHSGIAVLFICSAVLFGMLLMSFWHGDKGKKNVATGKV